MLLLYYKASFTWSKLLIYIDKLVLQHVFTRQGSQVRTLYHHQLNQALTAPSGAVFVCRFAIFNKHRVKFCGSVVQKV